MRVKTVLGRQNYEHARVLTPMNVDIRANLRPVRESSGLPVPTGSSRVKIQKLSRNGSHSGVEGMKVPPYIIFFWLQPMTGRTKRTP